MPPALPKKLSHRITIWIVLGVFIILIGFNLAKKAFLSYYFKHYQPPAVTVSSVTVSSLPWQSSIETIGSFKAVNGVDINSESSGNVVAIHFESGQMVEKDTLLIDIDDGLEQATLKSNQANFEFQKLNYKRQHQLVLRHASSQSEADAAEAELLKAQADLEYTKALIAQKHIRAPFKGRLGIRLVDLGQYILPGSTPIVTLQSLNPLYIEFYLPEHLSATLFVGQKINFSTQAYAQSFEGKITAINSKVDSKTHNIKIQATVSNCSLDTIMKYNASNQKTNFIDCSHSSETENQTYAFIPGMFAHVRVIQPEKKSVIMIPSTAIAYSLYGDSVFVIQDKPHHGGSAKVVKRVYVQVGEKKGNQVEILQGLKTGQTVVSSGEIKLDNDTRVIIDNSVELNTSSNPQLSHE